MTGTERQKEAITCHETSLVVSAGAGTGKTFVLVHKYMNLLETFGEGKTRSQDKVSVLQILALTFTEKAAAEMKERIRSELEKKKGDFWEKSRLEFLIAPVQTFHSFCAGVLREFAFEAGLEPSFVVLDERESSRILSLSFQELIHTPTDGDEKNALVRTLSLVGTNTLEKMIRYLYQRREEADRIFSLLKADPDGVIAHWQEVIRLFREEQISTLLGNTDFISLIQTLLAYSSRDIPPDDKVMTYLQKVKPYLERMQHTGTADEFLAASESIVRESLRGGSQKYWQKEELSDLKNTNRIFRNYLDDCTYLSGMNVSPGDPFCNLIVRFLQALGITFNRFCTIVDTKKSDAGGMDFSDLIRYTRHLFRTRGDLVASYYRERFSYILIDEFQDTDPAQFEIVTTIIGEPSPDVQGLFIVGDPKQSIYLFRDADVTRFRDAQTFITESCAGKNIPLDVCFRSSPAVVTFVNYLFSRLFRSAEKPWEFMYDEIRVSDDRSDHTGSVTLMLIRKNAGITEYDAIADRIQEMIKSEIGIYQEGPRDSTGTRIFQIRPAVYGDIAILLERRTHIGLFIHSLASRNIPYYVYKGTGFYNRQEILDLISLLSVLYRPYDDVHLVGLLRSPYIGLSDLEILRISWQPGGSFLEKLCNSCSLYPEFTRAYSLISLWQERARRLLLVPLIQSVLDESGVLTVYGGLIEGDQILSNIGKLLGIVRTREEGGMYHLPDLVADLLDALDHEEEEGEAMIDDPDMNAVTIMTIHTAKGLEFPIVFVPEMDAPPNLKQDPILLDGTRNLLGVQLPNPGMEFDSTNTPVYTLLKKGLDEKLLAEKRRLLYVALTRSADHLIMSGKIGENDNELPDGSKHSRLDWIIPTLGITGDVILKGGINLKTDNGKEVEVSVIIPSPVDRECESIQPPFTIPADMMDCPGLFTKTQYQGSIPAGVPLLVTGIAGSLYPPGQEEGREGGAVFGSAVHEVLRGRDPDSIIQEFGIDNEDQLAKLYTISEEFWSLPLLSDVLEIQKELAFCVTIDEKPLTGRMDLVVRLADGTWMVIDYKSENIPVPLLAGKESYRFQVEIYRRAAEILGMKPARGALYSVFEKTIIELDPWTDEELFRVLRTTGDLKE